MDHLLAIWRWKWIILLGTLACVIAAGLVTWNAPRTYRIRAAIATGDLSEDYGKDVERLIAKLNAESSVEGRVGEARAPGSGLLTVEFKKPAIIELGVITEVPDGAVATVRRTTEVLVDELNGWMDTQQAHYRTARRRAEELHAIVERLRTAQAAALRQASNPDAALVLSRLSDGLAEKETRLAELERVLRLQERRQARPKVLVPPEVSRLSIRLRLATNLAISLAIGLAGSLAFVFVMPFVSNARRQGSRGTPPSLPPDPPRP